MDAVAFEIVHQQFASIAEEMGRALQRSAFSPNIKERRDFSCAIFNAAGEMLAQAEHIPVHLGSMPASLAAALAEGPLRDGDVVVLNDPFRGGTHLPDLTVVMPVYVGRRLAYYVANRAHHADVGGMTPGSMPLSTDLFQEGFRIPPTRLVVRGRMQEQVKALFLANVRTPVEREGDLRAQIAANRLGAGRLVEVARRAGRTVLSEYERALASHCRSWMRQVIRGIPPGVWKFRDELDGDGVSGQALPVVVALTVADDRLTVDFTGTAPQSGGCLNAPAPVTLSAVFYALRCLTAERVPMNRWSMERVRVALPDGSLVNPRFPAAVCGGNVETSQRVVDAVLGALAQALPDLIPAASCGSMNNIVIGSSAAGAAAFSYYETIAGGAGGSPAGPGASALHTHMTNTLNTPVEALEHSYPLEIVEYAVRRGSGGAGRHRGGDGVIRVYRLLRDARVSLLTERRARGPYGLRGGARGGVGRNSLIRAGRRTRLPAKANLELRRGDLLVIETPGGGGWGRTGDR